MADNTVLNPGAAGDTIATDDIAGVKYPISKLAHGALDSATIVSTASGLPVQQQGTWTVTGAGGTFPVTDSAGSLTVDNAGTFAVQVDGAALTSLQLTDDIVHSGDAAVSKYALIGAVLDDAATATVTENQAQSLRMSSRRALLVEGVASGTNINVNLAASAATVTVDSELPAAAALADAASATPTTPTVGAVGLVMNATTLDRQRAVVNALDSTGTGIAAAGLVGQLDDVATGTVTENQFAPVRISSRRAILIEGVASGTAITVGTHDVGSITTAVTPGTAAGNLGKAEDAAHASGDTGVMALAVRSNTAASTSGTDGDYQPLITNTTGHLWVDASGQTLTVGSHAVTNAGTFVVQENGSQVQVDDAAFTPATSKILMAGFTADETSTDSVDEGDGGAARITLDRKQIVTIYPHTAGGLTTMNASSSDGATALTSTAQVIKASAGQLYGYYIYNPNSSAQFVQFYNTAAASVTVGTTNPLFMLTIPATSAANLMSAHGIAFSNAGWSWSATSTAGGNGAPTTALDAIAWYN